MKREQALHLLLQDRDHLKAFQVKSLSVFGSTARDEATEASDVDILVEFVEGAQIGLFRFVELKQHLEIILGCPVDLGTLETLKETVRSRALREAIRVA